MSVQPSGQPTVTVTVGTTSQTLTGDQASKLVSSMKAKINDLTGSATNLQRESEKLTTELAAVKGQLGAATTELTAVTSQLTTTTAKNAELTTELATAKGRLGISQSGSGAALGSSAKTIARLEKELAAVTSQLATANTENTELTRAMGRVDTDKKDLYEKLKTATNELNAANEKSATASKAAENTKNAETMKQKQADKADAYTTGVTGNIAKVAAVGGMASPAVLEAAKSLYDGLPSTSTLPSMPRMPLMNNPFSSLSLPSFKSALGALGQSPALIQELAKKNPKIASTLAFATSAILAQKLITSKPQEKEGPLAEDTVVPDEKSRTTKGSALSVGIPAASIALSKLSDTELPSSVYNILKSGSEMLPSAPGMPSIKNPCASFSLPSYESAKESFASGLKLIQDTAEKHPKIAIGIAATLGIAASLLIAQKFSSSKAPEKKE